MLISSDHLNDLDGMSLSMLPCEFCGEAMPSHLLVEHQSSCTSDPLSSLMPQNAASSNDGINANIQQTDNRYSRIAQETRPNPPFIDNLSQGLDWPEMSPYYDATSSEDIMLPCEFCDELFPSDVLVQHQAMCDANGTVTPRVTTPALNRSSHRKPEQPNSSRSKRRQQEPDLGALLSKISDKRTPSSGAAWSSREDVTPQQEIHSTMHKYGVSPGESVISKTSRQAILEHLAREKENKTPKATRRTSHPTTSKRIDSATRTRNTLENLLHEDIGMAPPHHDLHRHVNVTVNTAKKYNKDNFNTQQKKLPTNRSTTSTTTVSRPVPTTAATGTTRSSRTTGVSSREVHRQLAEFSESEPVNMSQITTKSTRSSRSNVQSLADRPPPSSSSTSNGASRQRTRNNIFDSGNRNTRSTRRSSDDNQ
ncbi:hypothetical protein KUTeg_010088 [Tegillarca granosa]|uniref:UBZ4-type domain-containing protein n=1 Tax=Tegillarca granosa TaxID=220873 RepID=A0ABQ9F8U7_TEGGR|nr:hypothetical protein KUTeg_010088 [Tegillarca granosa]